MSYIVAAPIAKFLERIRVITKYKKMDDYIFTNQDSGKQNVETLYVNVLGRDYDQEGYNYWVGNLNAGIETRYELLLGFAESAENKTLFTEMTGFG